MIKHYSADNVKWVAYNYNALLSPIRYLLSANKGLGLIELMVTVAIVTGIGGVLMYYLVIGGATGRTSDIQAQVTQDARKGVSTMTRELRQTRPTLLKTALGTLYQDSVNYNSISFQMVSDIDGDGDVLTATGVTEWSSPITYTVSNNQLVKTIDNATIILANNVTSVTFMRSINLLTMTLQTQKTTAENRVLQMGLTSMIKMRD